MKPVNQTILHDPENGLVGNCFQAAVASVLELPLELIPHFVKDHPGEGSEWWIAFLEWLEPQGLYAVNYGTTYEDGTPLLDGTIRGWHLMGGESPRDNHHSVVGWNGKMIFDPHPSRDGLSKVTEHVLFLATDPALAMRAI